MRTLSLLGATGSIGDSTLDVVARHPERFAVAALTANTQWQKLETLCRRHRPQVAALLDVAAAHALERALAGSGLPTRVLAGAEGLRIAATLPEADTVLAAIVGAAGLQPTLAAARAGKRLLLANKEALVIGGAAFMAAVAEGGATLLPIDSEHNAIFQCLPRGYARDPGAAGVRRILLTASGGPFRTTPTAELAAVTPERACAHPKWVMGRKISVDSATMMNKGLEVIEAHWLFGAPRAQIEVVIHPESVIHSLVEYVDGSVLAQLGNPDMRTPIAQALAYPERVAAGVAPLELVRLAGLTFEAPDLERFPCLALAYAALDAGGTAPAVLNAANEVAVEAFLARRIGYTDIAPACAEALRRVPVRAVAALADALAADDEARSVTRSWLKLPAPAPVSL
jgi:1-deoxy-D-xylulose-5-phosphate reductoisomerase